jgi:hypothetical protein
MLSTLALGRSSRSGSSTLRLWSGKRETICQRNPAHCFLIVRLGGDPRERGIRMQWSVLRPGPPPRVGYVTIAVHAEVAV